MLKQFIIPTCHAATLKMTINRLFLSLSNGEISCRSQLQSKCNIFAFILPDVVVCDRQSLVLAACKVYYGKYDVDLEDAKCELRNDTGVIQRTCHVTANINHAVSVHEIRHYAMQAALCVLACAICAMFLKTRSTLKKQDHMALQTFIR